MGPLPVRVVFALFLVIGSAARAQAASGLAVGVQLGGSRCGIVGDVPPNAEYTQQLGLIAGVQGEIAVGDQLHLSLQPSFVQRKTGLTIVPSVSGASPRLLTLAFDYVSVPVVLKIATAGGRAYVAGGGAVDFMTAATLSESGADKDVMSSFNHTGFGAVIGFGVVFPARGTRLGLEVRFVQGLVNLAKGTVAEKSGALAPRLHSNGLELIVGDLFSLGRR